MVYYSMAPTVCSKDVCVRGYGTDSQTIDKLKNVEAHTLSPVRNHLSFRFESELIQTQPINLKKLEVEGAVNGLSTVKDAHPAASDLLTIVPGGKDKRKPEIPGVTVSKENANCDPSEQPVPGRCDADVDADSDSDDTVYTNVSGYRLPYTFEEDEWILTFVLKDQNIFKVSSISLWKRLEAKKENPKRTYQSLKNRFLRSIRPHLFTRYKHLIKGEIAVQRILAKFPELKHSVGRTNTLSQIHIPERKEISRGEQVGATTGAPKNDERTSQLRKPVCETTSDARKSSNSTLFDGSDFTRKVKIGEKSVKVTVEFKSKKHLESPTDFWRDSSLGIYEKYKKFKEKNKLILCTACGRYNRPKRNNSVNSSATESCTLSDSDVLIANSLDPPGERSKHPSAGHKKNGRRKKSASSKRRRVEESEKLALEAASSSGKGQGAEAQRNKADGDIDEELDDAYEESMRDFRKLISRDDERLLIKKCLWLKREIVGIDSRLGLRTDSFFVELSPSEYYSSQLQVCESASSTGSLAKNMMRMLGAKVNFEASC